MKKHRFAPTREIGWGLFADCICGWSGGYFLDELSARAEWENHSWLEGEK